EWEGRCRQMIKEHAAWCEQVTGRRSMDFCLFGDLNQVVPDGTICEADTFSEKVHKIAQAPLCSSQYCHAHNRRCPLFGPSTAAAWETAGLPCPDHSRAGLRMCENGKTAATFACHAKRHIEKRTPVILIENVQELRVQMLQLLYGYHYYLHIFKVSCDDVGHRGAARNRLYVFLQHKERVRMAYDIVAAYRAVAKTIRKAVQTKPHDYVFSPSYEIRREGDDLAWKRLRRGLTDHEFESMDFRRLLTKREKTAVQSLCATYRRLFKKQAESDHDLIANLRDNPHNRLVWSATSGRIPTLRMSGGLLWHFATRRWLTARERLATLGFPVEPGTAATMGVPELPVTCTQRAAAVAGNCMNFSMVAVLQLVGLCCFEMID
ncbi:unnamed protein product, partial [Symbiodinium sp. CCMP2456]